MKSKKRTQSFFEENNYIVIKKVISSELASFIYIYFQNKRKVFTHMMEHKFLSPYDTTWGTFNDGQIPNTYSHYADMAMETLLARTLLKKVAALLSEIWRQSSRTYLCLKGNPSRLPVETPKKSLPT